MSLRHISAAFVAVCGMAFSASDADAAFSIRVSVDGVLIGQVDDGGATDQDGAANGFILISELLPGGLVIPDFDVRIEFSESSSPSANPGILTQLTNLTRTAAGSGVIEFFVSATDYVSPLAANLLESDVTNNEVLGLGETVEFQSWVDPDNVQFAIAGEVTTGPQVLTNLIGFDVATPVPFTATGPFSVSNRLRVTIDQGTLTQITADTVTTPIPEPGTMTLLAMGGIGLAGARWRRRNAA